MRRSRARCRLMHGAQQHRGPDDRGRVDQRGYAARRRCCFSFRRLAIIDLSPDGHQPMVDPATGNVVVFNGELYNYKELRSELQKGGAAVQVQVRHGSPAASLCAMGHRCASAPAGNVCIRHMGRAAAPHAAGARSTGHKAALHVHDRSGRQMGRSCFSLRSYGRYWLEGSLSGVSIQTQLPHMSGMDSSWDQKQSSRESSFSLRAPRPWFGPTALANCIDIGVCRNTSQPTTGSSVLRRRSRRAYSSIL